MTILWCGGEDIDFPTNTSDISTNTAYFRSSYARCAMAIASFSLKTIKSGQLSNMTSLWLTFRWYNAGSWIFNPSYQCFFGMMNYSTGAFIGIGSSAESGKFSIVKYDGSTYTRLATETSINIAEGPTVAQKIDINIQNYGSNGTVTVYVNGTTALTYTGDIAISGTTYINQFVAQANVYPWVYLSEFIIADEDTRLMSLVTYYPNATGDTDGWDGAYTDIDEVTLSDLDTIYTSTAEEDFLCNLSATPSGNFACKAVKHAYRAAIGASGLAIQSGLKSNSTLSLGTTKTLETAWATKEDLYQTNPATSNNFTIADLDALQIAYRSKAA